MKDIIEFDDNIVKNYFNYELKLPKKIKASFKYLLTKLPIHETLDLNKVKWHETKNYNWCSIKHDDVTLIIRKYHTHFTIYYKALEVHKNPVFNENTYGVFTYSINDSLPRDLHDELKCDNQFKCLNESLPQIIELLKNQNAHSLWNNYSFTRPDYIDVKVAITSNNIYSYDLLIFACEELFGLYLEFFAINDVFEKIKTFKENDMLDVYKIVDTSVILNDEYYHGVGLTLLNTNFPQSKPSWCDVYCLARYYYKYIFPETKENV